MNEAADHRTAQELSRLGDGLAAHVSVPPVMHVIRRATPLRRALFRLEDVAADVSVPPVARLIGQVSSRRRALVAGCSICALGAIGAALVFIPGISNGSTGPSELWAQQAGGSDNASQPSQLTMPQFSNDQVAQDTNQQPTAQVAAPQPAPAKPAVPVPAAAKPAATNTAAATRAAANTAAANAAAARQAAAQSLATQLPTTVTTRTMLTTSPASHATAGTPVTLTASVTATWSFATLTGTVQFTVDGNPLGSRSITNGTASIPWTTSTSSTSTTSTTSESHKLSAVFTPATANVSGSSNTVSFRIDQLAPSTTPTTPSAAAASLVAANTSGTSNPTVVPPPPPPPPPLTPSRGGRGRSGPPAEQLQQQVPAYQLQQAPAVQLPAQGSPRHH